jgi:hypothetical protein
MMRHEGCVCTSLMFSRLITVVLLSVVFVSSAYGAQLTLNWADNSTNEDGFYLERKTGADGTYQRFATLAPGKTSYTDTSVQDAVTYCYRVMAYNAMGNSGYSNEACATPDSTTSGSAATAAAQTAPATPASSGSSGGGGGGGGGCFIATAAFGSPLAPQVQLLREVRDRYLLPYGPGRVFVRAYYAVSPPIADVISHSESLRAIVRGALLPLLGWAAVALWSPSLGAGLSLLPVAVGILLIGRRWRSR